MVERVTYPVVPPEWAVYVGIKFSCTVRAWTETEANRLASEAVGATTAAVTVALIPF